MDVSIPDETEMERSSSVNSDLSALQDSIARKGTNSYYYAHGPKINGPAWDGCEQPRLIEKSESPMMSVDTSKCLTVNLPNYAWADEKKVVKVYVDFECANEIPDDDIILERKGNDLVELSIRKEDKIYKLILDSLNESIVDASMKKKTDKIVLSLKKENETSWFKLRKS